MRIVKGFYEGYAKGVISTGVFDMLCIDKLDLSLPAR